MLAKALVSTGAKVTVVSYKGVLRKNEGKSISYKGTVEGIDYVFASLSANRPENYFVRNFMKVLGSVNEFVILLLKTKFNQKNLAIITTDKLTKLKYYYFVLKALGYKVVLSYEEFGKSAPDQRCESLFDAQAHKYCDAILPISAFLEDYQRSVNAATKMFRVPVLTDFSVIDAVSADRVANEQLLFCGASGYYETIAFIVSAFEALNRNSATLALIIHGSDNQNAKVEQLVKQSKCASRIRILSNLDYETLIKHYKASTLLLIPLQSSERDTARFPHKISEYTASKTPLVTTAVGEIKSYFSDEVNAFIAPEWNVNAFAEKMSYALQNPGLAKQVAQNAYELGKSKFDYKSIGKDLSSFLNEV